MLNSGKTTLEAGSGITESGGEATAIRGLVPEGSEAATESGEDAPERVFACDSGLFRAGRLPVMAIQTIVKKGLSVYAPPPPQPAPSLRVHYPAKRRAGLSMNR